MIDLHTHILPGMDDGAADIEEALAMAEAAHKEGVERIVATPHHNDGIYSNPKTYILSAVRELNDALTREGLPVKVHPGAEIHLQPDLVDLLRNGTLLTLNDKGRALLIELPQAAMPPNLFELLFQMRLRKITPILAHPERNAILQEEPRHIYEWVNGGGLVQVTAASVLGDAGAGARKAAETFLRSGWVHILASDSHGPDTRPGVKKGFKRAKRLIGRDAAWKLVHTNPAAILEGRGIIVPHEPKAPRKRFWFR